MSYTRIILLMVILVVIVLIMSNIYLPNNFYRTIMTKNFDIEEQAKKNNTKQIIIKSKCSCHKDHLTLTNDSLTYTVEYGKVKYNLNMNDFDLDASTCDLHSVLSKGPNQKIIGYTVYGDNSRYYKQLDLISDQAALHYPEWTMRIYYDETSLQDYLCDYSCRKRNVVLCYANQIPYGSIDNRTWSAMYINKMMWRWLPTGDPFVDYFMSRDADSWIFEREAKATDEWLASNTLYHIMRDHPQHSIQILGGLWSLAVVRNRFEAKRLFEKIIDKSKAKQYISGQGFCCGADQGFLSNEVWPEASRNSTVHDSYLCNIFGKSRPYPTKRPTETFCYVSCNLCCNSTQIADKMKECPVECRPKEHQDWIYC